MNFTDVTLLTWVLGIEDAVCGVVMLWAALRITENAGFKTVASRWSLFRRALYCGMAWAFFSLGVNRLCGSYNVNLGEFAAQSTLVFGIMIFPLLRAVNAISQDTFLAFHGFGSAGDSDRASIDR